MIHVIIDKGNAPEKTGIGTYGASLEYALRTHASDEVSVAEAGISSIGKGLRPVRRILYLRRLTKLARSNYNGADIVHFVNFYVPPKRDGTRIISTIHDIDVLSHPEAYSRRYHRYFSSIIHKAYDRVDAIVTISEAVRKAILEEIPKLGDRLAVTGNSIHPFFARAVDAAGGAAMESPPYVLFVGRIERRKNLSWFIKVFADGVRGGALPDVRLLIAGRRGFGFEEIRRAMAGAERIVQWVPSPNTTELAELYMGASAVALPSVSEGFGIPLLEAMYCRKPIVASRIPSSVEVAGGAANFFELGSREECYHALNLALEDSENKDRLKVAEEKLEFYSLERFARRNLAVYGEVSNTGSLEMRN